MASQANLSMS